MILLKENKLRKISVILIISLIANLFINCKEDETIVNNDQDFTLQSPYSFTEYQHKVQLHTHSFLSDGDFAAHGVLRMYEEQGYTAVALTDHDYTDDSPTLNDPGGHNIIHIPGVEYSSDENDDSWNHMLGIMVKSIHHKEGVENRQAQIDQAKAEGGLTFLCHPYGEEIHSRGWSKSDVLWLVNGYDGIEIHNSGSYYDPDGRNYPYKVDLALVAGRKIFIIAVDDFHDDPSETLDRGCVIINSNKNKEEITLQDIIEALKSGNFYSIGRLSTNIEKRPRFEDITVENNTIQVKTNLTTDIEFITAQNNYYNDGVNYSHIEENTTSASYNVQPEDEFVRVTAVYTQNGRKSYAWSNPIYVDMEGK